jgi:hypothetical protein
MMLAPAACISRAMARAQPPGGAGYQYRFFPSHSKFQARNQARVDFNGFLPPTSGKTAPFGRRAVNCKKTDNREIIDEQAWTAPSTPTI